MLTRAQKETQVAELRDRLTRANCVVLADYRGLDVKAVNALRSAIRSGGGGGDGEYEYRVAKNRLMVRACQGSAAEGLAEHLQGPTAVAFSFGDPVGLAKILVDFAKDHEVFELKAGLLEGRAVGREELAKIATLPSLEGVRAQLVGLLQAPATKVVRLLGEPGGQLARLVEARRAALGESGEA